MVGASVRRLLEQARTIAGPAGLAFDGPLTRRRRPTSTSTCASRAPTATRCSSAGCGDRRARGRAGARRGGARSGECLASVGAALRQAREAGAARGWRVAVAVHRSADGTAAAVAESLADDGGPRGLPPRRRGVGDGRRSAPPPGLGRCAALGLAARADRWLLSTDADSVVPPDWVTAMLAHADTSAARCVAGLVDLEGWHAHPAAATAYEQIVRDGLDGDGHRHVYAANLAVRLDAYAAAGGFPLVVHGEDHGLVSRVRDLGGRVLPVHAPVVRTSARMPGRARHGLGDLLLSLAAAPGQRPPAPARGLRLLLGEGRGGAVAHPPDGPAGSGADESGGRPRSVLAWSERQPGAPTRRRRPCPLASR